VARPVRLRQELHPTGALDPGPAPAPPRRSRWAVVAALLGVAALVRVSAIFYENISGDDATVALMAKHILKGEHLPVFFYRQSYMGSLNGFHLVPALFVFGPSVLLVRVNAVAWSLLFPLGLYVLGRRLYDESAARVTLLLAAVPPLPADVLQHGDGAALRDQHVRGAPPPAAGPGGLDGAHRGPPHQGPGLPGVHRRPREHPRVSTRHAAILGVGLSDDGHTWRPVEGVRPAPEWAWAGRTLFTFSGGASELMAGGASGSAVRVEVRLPYRGEGAITSLCVRARCSRERRDRCSWRWPAEGCIVCGGQSGGTTPEIAAEDAP
jgi:hypothetical protein